MWTLKIRRPSFSPCAPDRHWAHNLFRLEFSSNSFQIHFKFTSNLLAKSYIFPSFLQIRFNLFQKTCTTFQFASNSLYNEAKFADDLLNGIKHMCS